ncbi:Aste57867_21505 [Aphanomyces stellatus]|uniref:Aste57867_21505 protein n=1 Tax=Aphanomyces stellatus TaxID=120398 RepID=A0A485LMI6_9STRA|nr:hypothetical protein As57867_021436 [Aphanomyces stellatus]VFT98175.1 Aste57867_21505 [Aphanomyces stellatus]
MTAASDVNATWLQRLATPLPAWCRTIHVAAATPVNGAAISTIVLPHCSHLPPPWPDFISLLATAVAYSSSSLESAVHVVVAIIEQECTLTNTTPCLPQDASATIATAIDALLRQEVTIHSSVVAIISPKHPLLHMHLHDPLGLPLDAIGRLVLVPLSFPPRHCRHLLDHVIDHGCIALLDVVISFLGHHLPSLLRTTSIDTWHAALQSCLVDSVDHGDASSFLSTHADGAAFREHYRRTYRASRRTLMRRSLDLADYSWLGFDVDGTLVEYRADALARRSFHVAVDHLVSIYPALAAQPRPTWNVPNVAQRCVAIDVERGNFLWIAADSCRVVRCIHGRATDRVDIATVYPNSDAPVRGMLLMHTVGDTTFAPLYAWLVDMVDSAFLRPQHDPPAAAHDEAAAAATYKHLSAVAKHAAAVFYHHDFDRLLESAPQDLVRAARRQTTWLLTRLGRTHGLFIVTNGSADHCDAVMTYAVGPAWRHHFELVVTGAKKDSFFDSPNTRRFTSTDGGGMEVALARGLVVAGGNAHALHAFLVRESTPSARVLYFGDHPVHDMQHPKHMPQWDTVGIVPELEPLTLPQQPWWRRGRSPGSVTQSPPTACHSRFFYFGDGEPRTAVGQSILEATSMCLPSVHALFETRQSKRRWWHYVFTPS